MIEFEGNKILTYFIWGKYKTLKKMDILKINGDDELINSLEIRIN